MLIIFDNFQIFIEFDSTYANVNSSNITYAMDLLLKSFTVFNIQYPVEAASFYKFLEKTYGIDTNSMPLLIELKSQIFNFNV